jgi:hypothetical protein
MKASKIPAGHKCIHRDRCGHFKYTACNGEGCPFSKEDISIDRDFSCATWRLLNIINKDK